MRIGEATIQIKPARMSHRKRGLSDGKTVSRERPPQRDEVHPQESAPSPHQQARMYPKALLESANDHPG